MAEIWRTQDRLGRQVYFSPAGRDHILERHNNMADRLDEVLPTIEKPDYVTQDADYPHRENHYRRTPSGRRFIKVVVEYRPIPPQGAWAGEVITAHISRNLKRKEAMLWP